MESIKIGKKIADARKQMNISQAMLGQRLFISPQAVGKWERGESLPDIITFIRLADILGVDLNYFSEIFHSSSKEKKTVEFVEGIDKTSTPTKQKNKNSWDMSLGNWVNADFSGLINLNEKFSSSNMLRCLFIGSDLSGLVLKNNNVNTCDFSESEFKKSQIQNSNLANNKFINCSLDETEFTGSYISNCDFSNANMSNSAIKSGGFEKNKVENVIWIGTSFIKSYISDIVFEGVIKDCYFENCALSKVIFKNSTLINTFFKNNKKLNKTQFIDCKTDRLTYEFLKAGKANLSGITLII
jgi:uncharacterized protein YjbI with pentapeptide repeats